MNKFICRKYKSICRKYKSICRKYKSISVIFLFYLFNTFNTRHITYRGKNDLCYDIPKEYIKKLDLNNTYKITNFEYEKEKIETLITQDNDK